MPREQTYQAIILKKQPYGEADELITVFTKEQGKLRVLAKSVKFAKSKLQYGLQTLFFCKLSVVGSKLPKVIGVEVLESFSGLRENLEAAKISFYILELALKFTPDEQINSALFDLLIKSLKFFSSAHNELVLGSGLAKFKIDFLESLGLGIQTGSEEDTPEELFFSNQAGGFLFYKGTTPAQKVRRVTYAWFLELSKISFQELSARNMGDLEELQDILSGFLSYHLEREIKSQRFML